MFSLSRTIFNKMLFQSYRKFSMCLTYNKITTIVVQISITCGIQQSSVYEPSECSGIQLVNQVSRNTQSLEICITINRILFPSHRKISSLVKILPSLLSSALRYGFSSILFMNPVPTFMYWVNRIYLLPLITFNKILFANEGRINSLCYCNYYHC